MQWLSAWDTSEMNDVITDKSIRDDDDDRTNVNPAG